MEKRIVHQAWAHEPVNAHYVVTVVDVRFYGVNTEQIMRSVTFATNGACAT